MKFNGYDVVYLKDTGFLNEIGKPMLPIKNILVALPENTIATKIYVLDKTEKIYSSTFNILPFQEPQKVGIKTENPVFIKNNTLYQSNEYYPLKTVELTGSTDLAGQVMAVITVYPFQYNPGLKTLKQLTNIKFVVECEHGYTPGDYLPKYISETEIKKYEEKVKSMVVNPENVVLKKKQGFQICNLDLANYDYVIITQSDWVSAFQPLADWKTKKGIPANIVTTEWIYSNYSGSTNKEKIRAFIQDSNINWGTTFFLLGGDVNVIPCHYVTYSTVDPEPIPTDNYYADYDNDWTCEVNVGRASVTGTGNGTGGIGNFINKILTYEKNPPMTNYAKNAALFGFDLDNYTDGEDCKIDIDNLYIPSSWNMTLVYDSNTGNHEDAVKSAVNSGQNLINHIDHSNYNVMGVGYFNHGWVLDSSEVDDFYNGNKQSIWYSIGCWAADFNYSNCIAEHFVRDNNGGGVAFIGNSRYGWYQQGFDDYLSLRYDRYFFRSLFIQNHYKLGDLFSDHKTDAYFSMTQNSYNKYIFNELNLLGDPELPIWMNNPANFVVSHPNIIPLNSSSFTVHVESINGSNIQNAYVCLWKTNEVYLTGLTNSNGNITFDVTPITTGLMSVTVTKQDYLPYEGNVTVSSGNQAPNTPSNPNPVNGSANVDINADISWNCSDPDGDTLTYDIYFGTTSPPPLVYSNYSYTTYNPGTMQFNTTYYWKIVAVDFYGASTTGPEWNFKTVEKPVNYPPEFSNENPANGATNVPVTTSLLSIYISDKEGDGFSWTIETSPFIGSSFGENENNGTKNCVISGLELNKTYTWFVNATDSGSTQTTTKIYTFKTETVFNNPPSKPIINGPVNGVVGVSYTFTFTSTDPDGDNIKYYIDWGDLYVTNWTLFYESGDSYSEKHQWMITGDYLIKAKAKDTKNAESEWATLKVSMPRNKDANFLFLKILNRYPVLFGLLKISFQKIYLLLK